MNERPMDTSFFRLCWDNLLTLIGLNLIFLLLCLPVITIPASIAALGRACQDMLLGEGHLFKAFFRSFRQNLWSAIPAGAVFVGITAGLLYGCIFYSRMAHEEGLWLTCAIFCFIGAYIAFCIGEIGFQVIARVELSTSAVLRNASFLLLQNPRLLFTWLLLAFLFPAITVWFFPRSLPIMALLPCALSSLAAARGTTGIIYNQLVAEQKDI